MEGQGEPREGYKDLTHPMSQIPGYATVWDLSSKCFIVFLDPARIFFRFLLKYLSVCSCCISKNGYCNQSTNATHVSVT